MKVNVCRMLLVSVFMFYCSTASFAQSANSRFSAKIIKTLHIASSGGWDYIALNPTNDNVYVSHATQVNILNRSTGDSVGVITNTPGVHGIAFAPEFNKGFTSNGKGNNLTVFDISTNSVLGEIKVGENPDAIMYDPFTKKIYVCNGKSMDLTVVDPSNNSVVKTIALGGKPETAVTDDVGKIFINIEDKNEVVLLNAVNFEVERRWKTGNGDEPAGLAIDKKTKRLFVGCGNRLLIVMNGETGKVVKEFPIGDGCDGVEFDEELKCAISSNGEGTISIIREKSANSFVAEGNFNTKKGARTLVLDTKTHIVYMPTAEYMENPNPSPDQPKKRQPMVPGSFQVVAFQISEK